MSRREPDAETPRPRRPGESLADYVRDALQIPEASPEEYAARRNETTIYYVGISDPNDSEPDRDAGQADRRFQPSEWIPELPFQISDLLRPAPSYEDDDQLADGCDPPADEDDE